MEKSHKFGILLILSILILILSFLFASAFTDGATTCNKYFTRNDCISFNPFDKLCSCGAEKIYLDSAMINERNELLREQSEVYYKDTFEDIDWEAMGRLFNNSNL